MTLKFQRREGDFNGFNSLNEPAPMNTTVFIVFGFEEKPIGIFDHVPTERELSLSLAQDADEEYVLFQMLREYQEGIPFSDYRIVECNIVPLK
jgi:hypothetical protein